MHQIRVPDLAAADPQLISAVVEAEEAIANNPQDPSLLEELDTSVIALYELEIEEEILVQESVKQARFYIQEGLRNRLPFTTSPSTQTLAGYASEVVETVNSYLRARGERHLEAIVYPEHALLPRVNKGILGVSAVRFFMVDGPAPRTPIIQHSDGSDAAQFTDLMLGGNDTPPYLNERRQLRIYQDSNLYMLKPSDKRYWTRTAGLNDADIILADHWLKESHASFV